MVHEIVSSNSLLPPEIDFNATSGIFSGTATPGVSVRLTSSTDPQMHSTMSGEDGKWKIALGDTPRLYTIFEIWACDQHTGTSSTKIKYVYGGSQPKPTNVYASKTVAFGEVNGGAEISVYGPDGALLGRDLVIGGQGTWTVNFRAPLNAGDTICVIASGRAGVTSLPVFTKAKTFSVDDRNVAHIAGSGAKPGEKIELFNRATGDFLASTDATELGSWSVSFCKLLERGTPITIRRVDKSGVTSQGPSFSASLKRSLMPFIKYFGEAELAGLAIAELSVQCSLRRNGTVRESHTVQADDSGRWRTEFTNIQVQSGDLIVAKSMATDETADSLLCSVIKIGQERFAPPEVTSIDQTGASGTAEGLKYIIASTAEHGYIGKALVDSDGSWTLDWAGTYGSFPKTTVVYFVVLDNIYTDPFSPTSDYVGRYADADGKRPEKPVITGQNADGAFYGTEEDTNSTILVYKQSDGMAVNDTPVPVNPDNSWVVAPDDPVKVGDKVYAQATEIGTNAPGATSEKSEPYTVKSIPAAGVPCPPEILNVATPKIFGQAQLNTWVVVTVELPNEQPKSFDPVETQGTSWHIDLTSEYGDALPTVTRVSATAQYKQDSTDTSGTYIKQVGVSTLGAVIINTVTKTEVTGISPVEKMVVQAWRGSDGKQIITNYTIPGSDPAFTAKFENGEELEDGDLLWLVCGYTDEGSMTPFNRQQVGYVNPDM
ncbi:Ig-like domain-containing protein [uncultured Martelella sp.]|uniref:Ig-like domain-containing protein n=1 Tax=uncultured Martelella sp. TaxID=392331 RepID=UPI0029C75E3C|nr:Ig-like domain-containing protein [uncultured Martelella sp.]